MDMRELDIDLIDRINPFGEAYAILAKTMSEDSLKQVAAAISAKRTSLVQRDLRRWGGGRESSFLYHHAKRLVWPSIVMAWVVYLAMPISVHPNFVILPFAVLSAIAIAVRPPRPLRSICEGPNP